MTWLLSLMLLGEFGLSTLLTRDLAARPEQTPMYLANSIAAKTAFSLPLLAILFLFTPQLAGNNPVVVTGLRWGAIFLCGGLVYSSFTAVFRAQQTMLPILWLTLGGQLALLAGTVWLLINGQSLPLIIIWTGFSQLWQIGLAFVFYRKLKQNQPVKWLPGRLSYKTIKNLIIRAWPFALAGFLAAFQLRANALLLAYLDSEQALGWYAAAGRFVEAARQLPAAFYAAILPALAALVSASSSSTLTLTFNRARLGLLSYSLLAAAAILLLAQPLLNLTYGPTFLPATPALQILALSLIPAGQNSLLIIYLYAHHDENYVNWLMGLGAIVNLGLCLWLIPKWGAAGTALALLLAECLLYLPYRVKTFKR
jgi:O-antigen/teichoic acid export membrane protein